MIKAPLPHNEADRLLALRKYGIVDTLPERDFDDLVHMASRICGTPMALISLIDAGRQWFKARVGLSLTQMHQEIAFCEHTIQGSDVVVVPDALADQRFADNPLVIADPQIRFYAGAPLVTPEGHAVGSLCVMDRVPRMLTNGQIEALRILSRQVVSQLELRRTLSDLTRAADESKAALDALRVSQEFKTRMVECSRDCMKVLDLDGRLLSMNSGGMEAMEICDLSPFVNASWLEFWQSEDRAAAHAAVATARAGGVGRFIGYSPTTRTGTPKWWDVVISPILNAERKPEQLLAVSRDVTDLKRAEAVLRTSQEKAEQEVQARSTDLAQVNAALRRQIGDRNQAEAILRAIIEGVEAETGDRFFPSLVRSLAQALGVQYAFVSELNADHRRFHTLAVWGRGASHPNFDIPVAGTPCEDVVNGRMAHYPERLQARFPDDKGLADWKAESYCGVPLIDSAGAVVGHLAIIHDEPMPDASRPLSIMRIFAARARAEIERLRAEQALGESEERFRDLFDEAPIAYVHEALDTRFLRANRAAMRSLGITPEEVSGTYGKSFIPDTPDAQRRLRDALESIGRGADTSGVVLELRRKDNGKPLWIQWWSKPDSTGQFTRTMFVDITDRVLMEEEKARLEAENTYLQEEIQNEHNFEEMIGASTTIKKVFQAIEKVAATDATVLVTGETGTGKELIARAIHHLSKRKDGVLVKVNCAALPAGLIESELFGHEKGAFTGALARKIGRFELADGATIFLDEIGDLPLDLQAKLLRVLQEGEFERLGNPKTLKVNVRVITATNRDLERLAQEGLFRPDLYYRLNVFPIKLPALRERKDDIPLLVRYFIRKFGTKLGKKIDTIPQKIIEALQAYPWPGNIRELENVLERAMILSQGNRLELTDWLPKPATVAESPSVQSLEELERAHMLRVLEETGWRVSGPKGAASVLGLKPTTMEARMKKLGIKRKPSYSGLTHHS